MTGSIMTPRGLEKPPPVKGSGTTSTLWPIRASASTVCGSIRWSTKVSRSAASTLGAVIASWMLIPKSITLEMTWAIRADDPAAPRRSNGEEGLAVPEQQHGRHVVHPALVTGD